MTRKYIFVIFKKKGNVLNTDGNVLTNFRNT